MQGRTAQVAAWVGIAIHVIVGPVYAVTGLLAPAWAVGLLGVIWLGLLVFALLVRRGRPWWAACTPLVSISAWFGVLMIGERLLGWAA